MTLRFGTWNFVRKSIHQALLCMSRTVVRTICLHLITLTGEIRLVLAVTNKLSRQQQYHCALARWSILTSSVFLSKEKCINYVFKTRHGEKVKRKKSDREMKPFEYLSLGCCRCVYTDCSAADTRWSRNRNVKLSKNARWKGWCLICCFWNSSQHNTCRNAKINSEQAFTTKKYTLTIVCDFSSSLHCTWTDSNYWCWVAATVKIIFTDMLSFPSQLGCWVN